MKTKGTLTGLFLVAVLLVALFPLTQVTAQGSGGKVPSIRITTPKNGQVVKKQDLEVTVVIKDFKLDRKSVGKAAVQGRGHWHLIVDGKDLGPKKKSTTKVKKMPVGDHIIEVSLRNNDHSLLSPPASDSVKMTITAKSKGYKGK